MARSILYPVVTRPILPPPVPFVSAYVAPFPVPRRLYLKPYPAPYAAHALEDQYIATFVGHADGSVLFDETGAPITDESGNYVIDQYVLGGQGIATGALTAISIGTAWQQPFTQPWGPKRALATHAQPYLAFVKAAPFPEQVSADRWWRALSEPTRRKTDVSSQPATAFAPVSLPFPAVERWVQEFGRPVLRKPFQFDNPGWAWVTTAALAEPVTADRWAQPLEQPTRRRVDVSGQPTGALVKAEPFQEVVLLDRWWTEFGRPVLRKPFQFDSSVLVKADPFSETVVANWAAPLEQPTRRKPFAAQSHFEPPSELTKPDKWLTAFPLPTRRKIDLSSRPAIVQPYADYVSAIRWMPEIARPTLRRSFQFDSSTWSWIVAPSSEIITADKWVQPLAAPTRRKIDISGHPAGAFVKADPFPEAVSADRWWRALSEPTRRTRFGPVHALALVKAAPFPENVSIDRWLQQLAIPTRRRGPHAAAQPFAFFDRDIPAVELKAWYMPFGQPRFPRGLAAPLHPLRGYTHFTPTIAFFVTVGHADGSVLFDGSGAPITDEDGNYVIDQWVLGGQGIATAYLVGLPGGVCRVVVEVSAWGGQAVLTRAHGKTTLDQNSGSGKADIC